MKPAALEGCCGNEDASQADQKYSQDIDLTMTYSQNIQKTLEEKQHN